MYYQAEHPSRLMVKGLGPFLVFPRVLRGMKSVNDRQSLETI